MNNTPLIKIDMIYIINKLRERIIKENMYGLLIFLSYENDKIIVNIKNNKPKRHNYKYEITELDIDYILKDNFDDVIEEIYDDYMYYIFNGYHHWYEF